MAKTSWHYQFLVLSGVVCQTKPQIWENSSMFLYAHGASMTVLWNSLICWFFPSHACTIIFFLFKLLVVVFCFQKVINILDIWMIQNIYHLGHLQLCLGESWKLSGLEILSISDNLAIQPLLMQACSDIFPDMQHKKDKAGPGYFILEQVHSSKKARHLSSNYV